MAAPLAQRLAHVLRPGTTGRPVLPSWRKDARAHPLLWGAFANRWGETGGTLESMEYPLRH